MRTGFAFDLDGTLTRQELLPMIAAAAGLEEEIGLLTRLTIDGTLSFAASFKLRFAILRSLSFDEVRAATAAAELDAGLAAFVCERPGSCRVVTGNIPQWIQPLTDRLGCGVYSSEAEVRQDRPVYLSRIINKADAIEAMRSDFDRIVAIGEGANDVAMFDAADVSIAYGGIHEPAPQLLEVADYVVYESSSLCRLLNTLS